MSTGIGSILVVDPATPAAGRLITFTDSADPVQTVAAQPRPDGSMIMIGSRRFGRPVTALIGLDGMVSRAISFGERSVDGSTDIADLGNGEYGITFGNRFSNGKLQIARLDATGAIPTVVTLGAAAMKGVASAIAPRQGGGYFVAGEHRPTTSTQDLALLAMNADDTIAWQKNISSPGRLFNSRLTPLADGGVLIMAYQYAPNSTTSEAWGARFDAAGTLQWQRSYGTLTPAAAAEISGGFLVAASTPQDMVIVQLAADGTVVGARTYNDDGSSNAETARGIATTPTGGASLVGFRTTGTAWHVFQTGADLSVAGCGDPSIGAMSPTTAIPGTSASLTIVDGALAAVKAAPAFPTEVATLPTPVSTSPAAQSFCQ